MANKIEKLADDLMNLTKDEAQQLQLVIKAKLMPEVERHEMLECKDYYDETIEKIYSKV
jgi:hypothetical protein